jgi:dCMP deaminase
MGYNGMPIGCNDDLLPWGREGDNPVEQKYMYVCHAEFNAILNARVSLDGSRIYVTLFPCNECAKAIIQSGIKEVIYYDDKYKDLPMSIASRRMFDLAGVTYRKFEGTMPTIEFKRK